MPTFAWPLVYPPGAFRPAARQRGLWGIKGAPLCPASAAVPNPSPAGSTRNALCPLVAFKCPCSPSRFLVPSFLRPLRPRAGEQRVRYYSPARPWTLAVFCLALETRPATAHSWEHSTATLRSTSERKEAWGVGVLGGGVPLPLAVSSGNTIGGLWSANDSWGR